ncbi:dihydrofolate reductase isoform X2 [Coffea eugenioides]|uniref:dihydrofolate reductase isoform X2 n=1 Tax=Coffea eugenioides TaxID=49369 RepID=UPI000F6133C6|nr:dihydrofolate reductase isoform X2 [Coffea eugenioides]
MHLFHARANPKLKGYLILLIMNGFNSIRSDIFSLKFCVILVHDITFLAQEFTEHQNFDECLAYIEDCMVKHGPFDGLLGFSQGAILSAALPGLQEKGVALTKVPKIKFLIIVGGAKFKNQSVTEKAYASPIQCTSVHFLGEQDFLKPYGTELIESCVDPLVIHHPKGHTIPRFDDKTLEEMHRFLDRLHKEVNTSHTEQEVSSQKAS